MLRAMTQHHLHHEQTGHDQQLAAWVDHQKHEILARINHVHASVDELHGEHAAEPWWTAIKPVFQDIAQPAVEVTSHLSEIGRTDLPAYHTFQQIIDQLHAHENDFDYFAQFAKDSLWQGMTELLNNWVALLHSS
jgi:hypothetical protein